MPPENLFLYPSLELSQLTMLEKFTLVKNNHHNNEKLQALMCFCECQF